MEISALCDVKACAIIIDADGTIETWPKNPTDVTPILDQYRKKHYLNKKKHNNNVDVVVENPNDVLSKLNSKIDAVKKRIEFLKGISTMNRDGDGGREDLSDIIGSSNSATVNVQESDTIEQPRPLDYYWDGHIELSDNNYATTNVKEISPNE
ncbi:hypothetical protein RND71_040938 [Anisodus tanguticus]|uniref:MADS-box domain-containing protein n=1 Tax=Anisodus tanguticus TaxID=243964 RepID=A0AAE1UTT8_9SOLA|nr:hypothetical protein RND71_040938 [Anisodus tanguticus]